MEADQVTEEPPTTMDVEEHPSSKDPSAEDLQEHSVSETPLEPSISETPLGHSVSKIPLETPIPESPLETHIPKISEQHLSFHTSPPGHVSVSPSQALKEDPYSESSSSEVSWTKRSMQVSEPETFQKHSLSGPSAQAHLDTFAKEREEGEDEGVDASDSTAYTVQPDKKGKKGVSCYEVHTVVPAKQEELAEVAKAMHREKSGAQVNHLFQWEKNAALSAIQTGLYIGWRCPHYLWDCFQIGGESKCFCGHLLREHQIISEEVGEFWLKRRATFDPKAWRAQCRCKHSHEDHAATGSHPCRVKGCCCNCFESNFLCAACDQCWEEHETFFETEETWQQGGKPHRTDIDTTWHRPQ